MPQADGSLIAWEPLSHSEDNAIWDRFYAQFAFRPSVYAHNFPGIREPAPSLTFALPRKPGSVIQDGVDGRAILDSDDLIDLHTGMLATFRTCAAPDDTMYVLDWQHRSYLLRPHVDFRDWPTTIHPDGDYYIFLGADFSWGTFGHPWEWTICVFGQPLVDAVLASPPRLFRHPIRRDGDIIT